MFLVSIHAAHDCSFRQTVLQKIVQCHIELYIVVSRTRTYHLRLFRVR